MPREPFNCDGLLSSKHTQRFSLSKDTSWKFSVEIFSYNCATLLTASGNRTHSQGAEISIFSTDIADWPYAIIDIAAENLVDSDYRAKAEGQRPGCKYEPTQWWNEYSIVRFIYLEKNKSTWVAWQQYSLSQYLAPWHWVAVSWQAN